MSVCATNTVVFDARKVSLSRRKLADNERWAMLNKKTFQEILNALLAQSTSQSSPATTALTFALGQRSTSSASSITTKGRGYDFSAGTSTPKDERSAVATSPNLASGEILASASHCVDNDDDDDNDDDLEIEDRCAHEATDNSYSLPAASAAERPFVIDVGGTGQREFILGQSNLAEVGGNLQSVGIFIVCAMPPGADTSQYHLAARLLAGDTATRNVVARTDECNKPQARSLGATAFTRTGNEASSCATSELIARKASPRFCRGEKHKRDEEAEGSDSTEEGGASELTNRSCVSRSGIVLRSAFPVRNGSRLLNPSHPPPCSFDSNTASKICSRKLSFSAGKPGPTWMHCLNPYQMNKVSAASESFTSDFVQTSTTLSTETNHTSNALNTEKRNTSKNSSTKIRSTNTTASANTRHSGAELNNLARGTSTAERTQCEKTNASVSTHTCSTVTDLSSRSMLPFSTEHISTSCAGIRTKVPPSKDEASVALRTHNAASEGAAGLGQGKQSLSLSWSRWMAVDKDVLFCIIEHVLNAEAAGYNSGLCFKTPAPTKKGFSAERPAVTIIEELPDSSRRNNRERVHWAALFRSSQLGNVFEETGNRTHAFPVEPHTENLQKVVLANRTAEKVADSFVEKKTDALADSQDLSCKKTSNGDATPVEISRCFARFCFGRAAVGEKQRHRAAGRRHIAVNRKRKCFESLGTSGFIDRAPEVASPGPEIDQAGLADDDEDRQREIISHEKGVSGFKWKSKMMMRLRVESHRMIAFADKEGV